MQPADSASYATNCLRIILFIWKVIYNTCNITSYVPDFPFQNNAIVFCKLTHNT